MPTTVTELLQETKTLKERISKKRDRLVPVLCRSAMMQDVHEENGGGGEHVKRELQAIGDLEERYLVVKAAIARSNSIVRVNVQGDIRTVADWIHWRRDLANPELQFMARALAHVRASREKLFTDAKRFEGNDTFDPRTFELVVNFDEHDMAERLERLELIVAELDAKLSVSNATTQVELS